ncbi:hypothetical protein AWB74_07597 [Caballeronia arvi]|uniref:Uncharacterized protein n=1 Tax=Caballeronia arvi TaxID=1777135 RepID=A0A158KZJ9_9BURK|nr:hypothetical protein [Caballeronia arvi]SAL86179.1 hypothetical protein AWB74_07597 [Caballeronia arvi]
MQQHELLGRFAGYLSVAIALSGCGGDSGASSYGSSVIAAARSDTQAAPSGTVNGRISEFFFVSPPDEGFRGRTYAEWETSFWQWTLSQPIGGPFPQPFDDCNRPISAAQRGPVWYWSAPMGAPVSCDQTATPIPQGTAIFLTILNIESSSLDDPDMPPFRQLSETGQREVATKYASRIENVFCRIDGNSVPNLPSFLIQTKQFSFVAPRPWIFNRSGLGGQGTAVGSGYFLMVADLSAGEHTIEYGGKFHFLDGDFGPGSLAFDLPQNVTLRIQVGRTPH